MSENHIRFRSLGRGSAGGMFATVLLHGALVALVWWSQRVKAEPEPAVRDLMVTQLVKFGKPREKFWLPRLTQPRKTAPQAQVKISDNPEAAPAPEEAPRPEKAEVADRVSKAQERARLLQDAIPEEDEGALDGSELGTANEASIGDAYATTIFTAIRGNWNVPVGIIADDELARLSARVKIAVLDDGTLTDTKLITPSGNSTFDDSCIQAILTTARVPPPPPEIRAMYRKGVGIVFKQ